MMDLGVTVCQKLLANRRG